MTATPLPQAPEGTPLIECRNASVRFGDFTALHDVTLTVPESPGKGNFISILGPSGCGKSTLLNLVAGLLMPSAGQVLYRGQPVTRPGSDRGMIFQQYSSFPHLNVRRNVLFGMEINKHRLGLDRRQRLERAGRLIDHVGLAGHEDKYPHQLSGGQQQRVAIARTLALEPGVLLMDEPFSALDEPTRLEMQELIVQLWDRIHPTILCVTHSITEAVYLGERVWIFSRAPGQVAFDIGDCIPRSPGIAPRVAQEQADFKNAARVVMEAFRRVSDGQIAASPAAAKETR
ncbi:MAG: ABC transporter ATP-binding protein [Planctomycetota bacterium]|nr:ABC transporter ATP-binding protein [Planctomycetota bacterium]